MSRKQHYANPDYMVSMFFFATRPFFMLSIAPVAVCLFIISVSSEFLYSTDIDRLFIQMIAVVVVAMCLDGGINVLNISLDEIEDRIQGKVTALTMNYLSRQPAIYITVIMWMIALLVSLQGRTPYSFLFAFLAIVSGLFYQDSIITRKITGYRPKDHYLLSFLTIWLGYVFLSFSILSFSGPISLEGSVFAVLVGCFQGSLAIAKDKGDVKGDIAVGKLTVFLKFGMKRGHQIILLSLVLPILIGIGAVLYNSIDLPSFLILNAMMAITIISARYRPRLLPLLLRCGIITVMGLFYLVILLITTFSVIILQFTIVVGITCFFVLIIIYKALENEGYQNFEQVRTPWYSYLHQKKKTGISAYVESLLSFDVFVKRLQDLVEILEITSDDYLKELDRRILYFIEEDPSSSGFIGEIEGETSKIKDLVDQGNISMSEWKRNAQWPIGEYLAGWTSPDNLYSKKFVVDFFNRNFEGKNGLKTIVDLGGPDIDMSYWLSRLGFPVWIFKETPSLVNLGKKLALEKGQKYQVYDLKKLDDIIKENSVDVVTLINPLYSLLTFEILLEKAIDILKPDGTLILIVGAGNAPAWNHPVNSFEELRKLLRQKGTLSNMTGFEFEAAHWIHFTYCKLTKKIYLTATKKDIES
ncbi:MAG: UbiA family prenyltransferase [Candidatus Odinarchaeota archaeon]